MEGRTLTVDQRIRQSTRSCLRRTAGREAVEHPVRNRRGNAGADQPFSACGAIANAIFRHITLNWDAVSAMFDTPAGNDAPRGHTDVFVDIDTAIRPSRPMRYPSDNRSGSFPTRCLPGKAP